VDLGSSYLPSDALAALLLAQLEARSQIQSRRQAIWMRYDEGLQGWARDHGVRLPVVPAHCAQAFHMFYLLMPSLEARQALIRHLRTRGILAVFHYQPLHRSPMGRRMADREFACSVTEDVSDRLLRLPFFNSLTEDEQESVIEAVIAFAGPTINN
jgi:dTDP-4-amino-4,6-dideoxygalactose transaminase